LLSGSTGDGAFNWDIVRDNARITKSAYQTRVAFEFMNSLVPGLVPEEILKKHFPLSRKQKHLYNLAFIEVFVLWERREACRKILVLELKWDPRRYGGMLLKFVLLRKLRHVPAFADWYVRRQLRYPRANDAR
jgi:hypothetical protein